MTPKSPIVQRLDEVQSRLATLLKPVGFARKGRAFRRETECGILQIIALQAGRFELGPPLPDRVKHWRPDNYVTRATIDTYLRQSHVMTPEPGVFLQVEMGSSCNALEDLRDRMDKELECKKSWSRCSEGLDSVWKALPTPSSSEVSHRAEKTDLPADALSSSWQQRIPAWLPTKIKDPQQGPFQVEHQRPA